MIRILIVDDQKTIRESMRALLASVKDFQVVDTAVDGYDAIAKVKDCQPDVILMDIEMPGVDGLEATKVISQQHPAKILILSSHDNDDLVAKSLAVGAAGYLLKNMPQQEIIRAIRFVERGYTSIKPTVSITASNTNLTNNPSPNSLANLDTSTQLATIESEKLNSLRLATPDEFLPSIQNWLVVSGFACLGIFIGAIALASQLTYKVTVKAPAKIRPVGELRIVQAAIEGKITDVLVKENQQVRSGQLIAKIDDARLQSQKQQLLANVRQTQKQLSQLDEQLVSLQAQTAAQRTFQQRNLASAQAQLKLQQRGYQERLITTQARVDEAEAAVELARDEFNRYQKLVETGIISQIQLQEKQAVLKSSLAQLQQVQASLNPSDREVAIAREQIGQTEAQGQTTLASLQREQQQLQERKTEIEDRLNNSREELNQIATEIEKIAIRAPLTGTIQALSLRNSGQVVRSGDEIATIAPSNYALEIKAAVADRDIGKVEVGQTAQMRVAACPYSDFSTLAGNVTAISADTKTQPEANSNYEIFIQPEELKLNAGDRTCKIRPGMEGRVDIISEEETILRFLLRKAKLDRALHD